MTFIQAAILGLLQGITEFLPVSSSGHLVIAQKLFQLQEPPVFFDIVVHLGTLSAVVFFFRREILSLKKNMLRAIIFASIPTGIVGLALNTYKTELFNSLPIVSLGLLATSGLLLSSRKISSKSGKNRIGLAAAGAVGLMQGLAVIPGISRSGATIVTGLWAGLNRRQALAFSFLLSIPAIIAALLLQLKETQLTSSVSPTSFLIGFSAAALTGFLALKLLKKILIQKKLYLFAFYTIPLAAAVFFLEKLFGR